ncbi:MAG: hypothetical protein LBG17_04740 [Bacteroidales bacterium]|jgi:hypothetical protein|nr:hypothetical protein [Bacteroidales bacterium]
MALEQINNGDTGLDARNKINSALAFIGLIAPTQMIVEYYVNGNTGQTAVEIFNMLTAAYGYGYGYGTTGIIGTI